MTIDFGKVVQRLLGINWRTTIGGSASFLSALAVAATSIGKGEWPSSEAMGMIGIGLSTAWGLFMAKDKNVTGGQISNVDGTKSAEPISIVNASSTTPIGKA